MGAVAPGPARLASSSWCVRSTASGMFERRRPSIVLAGTAVCLLAVLHICTAEPAAAVAARSKRGVPFLQGSGNGYIIAIALPIGSGRRHVFTAFNFELHFGLPDNSTYSPTGLKTRWEGKRSVDDIPPPANANVDNEAPKQVQQKSTKSMLTRKHVYRVIENQLFRNGFNGTACLLKTICNTAESDLFENNGVFGNLFHIVFTPTASKDEQLPQFFYDAEEHGRRGKCDHFQDTCPKSLLEYVSTVLELFE